MFFVIIRLQMCWSWLEVLNNSICGITKVLQSVLLSLSDM